MKTVPTLLDVAHHSGFSKATVSRALRNDPVIPEATRTIIRKAAQTLGYEPNPMLASLSAHRWQRRPPRSGSTLAVLSNQIPDGYTGMRERAASYGFRTEVFKLGDYPDPHRLAEILFSRGILGLVVGQIIVPGFCETFDWSRFVAVACNEGSERPPVNIVMPNHFLALQNAWDHARALGYHRIGLMMFDFPTALDYHDRKGAFLDRQQEVSEADRIPVLNIKADFLEKTASKPQRGELKKIISEWLRQHQPEVVLGFNNTFHWTIKDAGWRIPKQVAFISLWTDAADRETTGMALAADEVGSRAVDWLDLLMRAGERGIPKYPAMMLINMQWQAGKTAPGLRV